MDPAPGVAAIILHVASAFRMAKQRTRTAVGGVPMLNYHFRHLQDHVQMMGGPNEYDWIIKFKDGSDDELMTEFCGGNAGVGVCRAMGHPKHGGLPLVTVRMTEESLEELLQQKSELLEFVEPDSPVEIEPAMHSDEEASRAGRRRRRRSMWNLVKVNKKGNKFTGKGVHVYVFDSGVRVSHDDFGGRAVATVTTIG